jgi:hypothetical protein
MIVIEGPDGAGKTTLLKHLQHTFPEIETAPRFSSSEGGPVQSLGIKVATDLNSWWAKPLHFYDRHPFISELIYGPILRSEVKDNLHKVDFAALQDKFYSKSLIIVCLPGEHTCRKNLDKEPQLAGVGEKYTQIYRAYQAFLRNRTSQTLNPNVIWYDYELHSTQYLEDKIKQHQYIWENRKGIDL